VEVLHLAEVPAALRAWRREAERRGVPWSRGRAARAILATLSCGYPSWVPRKSGVFD
jgi:hypothetical protein